MAPLAPSFYAGRPLEAEFKTDEVVPDGDKIARTTVAIVTFPKGIPDSFQ